MNTRILQYFPGQNSRTKTERILKTCHNLNDTGNNLPDVDWTFLYLSQACLFFWLVDLGINLIQGGFLELAGRFKGRNVLKV